MKILIKFTIAPKGPPWPFCAASEKITVKMELLKSSIGAEPVKVSSLAEGKRDGNKRNCLTLFKRHLWVEMQERQLLSHAVQAVSYKHLTTNEDWCPPLIYNLIIIMVLLITYNWKTGICRLQQQWLAEVTAWFDHNLLQHTGFRR